MDLIIIIAIIAAGYFFGRRAEKKHYISLQQREEQYKNIVVLSDTDLKHPSFSIDKEMFLSNGVAIALDAFKNFLAAIVGIL
jgi:hypothetical protein